MTRLLAGPAAAISAKSRLGCFRSRVIDRHRLRPANQRHVGQHRDQRKQQRADRIDVHGRVERQPAQLARRRIAEPIRRPRMRRLVHRQRRDQHDELDENLGEIDAGQNQKVITRSYTGPRHARIVSSKRSTSAGVRPEIDDAGAQREAAVDGGVRQIRIAVALDLDHQRAC